MILVMIVIMVLVLSLSYNSNDSDGNKMNYIGLLLWFSAKIRQQLKLLSIVGFWAFVFFNSWSANPTKWSNTLKQFFGYCRQIFLSVFNHFMGLALKGLKICFSTILPLLQLINFLDTAAIASPLQIIKKIEASWVYVLFISILFWYSVQFLTGNLLQVNVPHHFNALQYSTI